MLRAQLELGQVKQEIDRRIAEKEEEGWRNVSELRYALFMNDEKIINIVRAILGPEQDRSRTNYPGYKYKVKH